MGDRLWHRHGRVGEVRIGRRRLEWFRLYEIDDTILRRLSVGILSREVLRFQKPVRADGRHPRRFHEARVAFFENLCRVGLPVELETTLEQKRHPDPQVETFLNGVVHSPGAEGKAIDAGGNVFDDVAAFGVGDDVELFP